MDKEGSYKGIFIVAVITILIASFWNSLPYIPELVHAVLNPTAGALLDWNITWGMTIIVFIVSIFMTIVQKYGTDQEEMKRLKKEQKELNKKAQEFRHDPEKMMEINKELFPQMGKMMKLGMRPIIYTGIPLILFFRWFYDYFGALPEEVKFFGFLSWFWFYLLGSIIFSSILRKIFNVA